MAEGGFLFGGNTGLSQAPSSMRNRRLSEILMREGMSTDPVRHPLQGFARVAQGVMGAIDEKDADAKEKAMEQLLLGAMGGGTASAGSGAQSALTGAPTAMPDSLTGGGAPATSAPTNASTASDVAFFNSRGWTPVQSAAIVGAGIIPESSGRTDARNPRDGRDGSDSVGMVQWNGPRAIALQQFAAQRGTPWTDRATQLAFIDAELRGQVAGSNESRWGNQLAAAQDPRSAARAVISYLRPAGWTAQNPEGGHNWGLRYGTAQSLAGRQAAAPGPQAALGDAVGSELPIVGQSQTVATTAGGMDDFRESMRARLGLPPSVEFSARGGMSPGGSAAGGAAVPAIMTNQTAPAGDMLERSPQTVSPDDAAWAERMRLAAIDEMRSSGAAPADPAAPSGPGDMLDRSPQTSAPNAGDDAAWAERQRLAAIEDAKQRGLPWSPDTFSAEASPPMAAPMPAGRPGILDATRSEGPGDIMNMAEAAPTSTTTAPTEAPVPMARPAVAVPQLARATPQPPAASNALPPGAAPAGPARRPDIARALGISERDRLALLRDEQSLAPGEADRLRGQAPVEMSAPAQAAAASPGPPPVQGLAGIGDRLRQLIAGPAAMLQPRAPEAAQSAAPASAPATAGQSTAAAGTDRTALLMRVALSPSASPQTRALAGQLLQAQIAQSNPANQEALRHARLQNQQAERALQQPVAGSPEALAAQTRARETEAERMGLERGSDAFKQFVLTGQIPRNAAADHAAQIDADVKARENIANARNMPAGPQRDAFVLTGKVPENAGRLSAADSAAVIEAEDQAANARTSVATLNRALELNPKAYVGRGAGLRAEIGGVFGLQSSIDTQEFQNAAMQSVLSSLKATFGGNPTEGERKILLEVEGAVSAPEAVREAILKRARTAAENRLRMQTERAEGIRAGTYFQRGGPAPAAAAAAGATPPATGTGQAPATAPDGATRQPPTAGGAVAVQTQAEADALQPGTRYRTPEGKEYIR